MGLLINQVMGDHTGKVGNLIYRRRNGKIVVYKVPEKIKKSESQASKDIRKKLKPMSQFASEVCSFPELKLIWESDTRYKAVAPYHKVEQANKNLVTPDRPTINCRIVPDFGFKLNVNSVEANKEKVSIVVTVEKELVDYYKQLKGFIVIILLCFYDPLKKEEKYFDFQRIRLNLTEWEVDKPVEVLFDFSEKEGEIFSKYKKTILYYTLLAFDNENYFLAYSESMPKEFDNNYSL
jgi:hypothetical protein